ncbi:hypothetical protein VTL71DRAFT_4402 [Oculimacula yallundae]|uniref:Uncharacterized protein n=1 Tax=Oculimacula yallundae TaxID=86028 RepID=A0ABR4C4A6_9HELO
MPLFSKSPPVTDTRTTHTTTTTSPRTSSSFLHRNSNSTTTTDVAPQRKSSLFSSRRRSPSPPLTTTSAGGGMGGGVRGLLHKGSEDASIVAARERVLNAEKREKEADIALGVARTAVREARESVKRLEAEAKEEARLAKIKQSQAKSISKRGHGLGRHDHV